MPERRERSESNGEEPTSLQRVKLYRLGQHGHWDDEGTGYVSLEYLQTTDTIGVVVIAEASRQPILIHSIGSDDTFHRYSGAMTTPLPHSAGYGQEKLLMVMVIGRQQTR